MSSSRLYADTHRKRQRYAYWRVLLVFILQTLIGTSYSISAEHTNNQTNDLTELRLSDTERLPLPPGDWRIELKTDFDFCRPSKQCSGTGGRAFLLHNLDLSTPVRVIVVRHTNRGVRNWRLNCYDRWSSFKDTHETQASGLTNKCSNGLDALVRYPTGYNDWWWEKFAPTFETLPKLSGWNTKFEIELNQQNKRFFYIDMFIERGVVGNLVPDTVLMAWKRTYVEGLAAGLFRGTSFSDPQTFALTLPREDANKIKLLASESTGIEATSKSSADDFTLAIKLNALRNSLDDLKEESGEDSEEYKSVLAELAEFERQATGESESKPLPVHDKQSINVATDLSDANGEIPTEVVPQVLTEVFSDPARFAKVEQERQRRLEADRAGIEAAAAQKRAREEELAREVARQEADRLARERDERERVAKVEQERQRRLEAARKAESVEQQLKRLQDTLAMLKEQAAQPFSEPQKLTRPPRHALVIGNAGYQSVGTLNNATADAVSFAKALENFGFTVALHTDIRAQEFKTAVFEFTNQVETGAEVIFYYAGHGVQFGSSNYLLPTDVGANNSEDVKVTSFELQQILNAISQKQVKFSLAVIDACRDNPFKVAAAQPNGRGLANNPKMQAAINASGVSPSNNAAIGQMVIYSASAGQQALDNLGPNDPNPNGLFTRVFLEKMSQSGLAVDRILRLVRNDVIRLAKSVNHDQVPALYDQTVGEFYFSQE